MATLGSLIVSLEANIAKFESDLGKAVNMANTAMGKISRASDLARTAISALVSAFAAQSILNFAKGLIEAAARLQELHVKTGASVEALSAMRGIATLTGTDIESVATSLDRMQKNAYLATSGNKSMTNAFAALGIGAKQLAAGLKEPDKLFLLVAQKLAMFRDDGNKTALMMVLLGRGGDQLAGFMKELAAEGYGAATMTKEQAAQAHELEVAFQKLVIQFKAAATTLVLDLLPAFEKLWTFAKGIALVGGTAFVWFYAIPKGVALVMGALVPLVELVKAMQIRWALLQAAPSLGLWTTALNGVSFSFAGLIGWQAKAIAGFNLLGAALVGYSIGTWLYDQSALVRSMGASLIGSFVWLGIQIKYAWREALAGMTGDLKGWLEKAGSTLVKSNSVIGKLAGVGMMLGSRQLKGNGGVASLEAQKQAELAANRANVASAYYDYVAEGKGLKLTATPAKLGSAPPTGGGAASKNDGLRQEMAGRLKIIADANKMLDAAMKTANMRLDADYKNNLISLADYGEKQDAILATNFAATQANYDSAIVVAEGYFKRWDGIKGKEAEAAAAYAKMAELADEKTADSEKHDQTVIANMERRADETLKLKKATDDLAISYQTMMGNTAAATELQIKQDDEMLRARLVIEGATESLKQLDAIEADRRLNAAQDPYSGMERGLKNYLKNIQDAAKQTEAITTHALDGVADCLTDMVMKGKADWKGLVTSMLAEWMKFVIQQQLMQPLLGMMGGGGSSFSQGTYKSGGGLGFLGSVIGAIGGALGGSMFGGGGISDAGSALMNEDVAGLASSGFSGPRAAGGPTEAGRTYLVGERGPELWRSPGVGRIIPNSQLTGINAPKSVRLAMTVQTPDADSFRRSDTQVRAGLSRMLRRSTNRDL